MNLHQILATGALCVGETALSRTFYSENGRC